MIETLLIIGSFTAFLTSMTIGANDVANSFATSVGAGVLTMRNALVIAAVFEFLGAFLMGSHVTNTIRKGIVDVDTFGDDAEGLALGMLCASVATGMWLALATWMKVPVSTTHSSVGSIIGFSLVYGGFDSIKWEKVGLIVLSWFASPLLSGTLTISLLSAIKKFALNGDDQLVKTMRIMPFVVGLTLFINSFFIIYKGTPALGLKSLDIWEGIGYSFGVGIVGGGSMYWIIKTWVYDKVMNWTDEDLAHIETVSRKFKQIQIFNLKVEKMFSYLQIFTACMSAFAHGANDVANSIAPYATIVNIWMNDGQFNEKSVVPLWILAGGGVGIVMGLALFGRKVIDRMGKELSEITAVRGFSMELGASLSVVTASRLGIPVSTTHCQVGSIVGGALTDGKKNVDWKIFKNILLSWFVTLPIAGGFSALLYYVLSSV